MGRWWVVVSVSAWAEEPQPREDRPLAIPVTAAARDDLICADLGASVCMFVWHNDEVRGDHPDMTIIATTDDCPNHIFRFRDQPIWGIQGHPEVTVDESRSWFEENRADLEADGADVDELHRTAVEASTAKTMLKRFADVVSARRSR